jgi:phosphomannomutase
MSCVIGLQRITQEMEDYLQQLNRKVVVGLVGGSDLGKISEQMELGGQNGK